MIDEKKIEVLIAEELREANKLHPLFRSEHEAYAVLLEEVEEAEYDLKDIQGQLGFLWHKVKCDMTTTGQNYHAMKSDAICMIQEVIQIAAMCQKAIDSQKARQGK